MSLVGGYASSYALQQPPGQEIYGSYYARFESAGPDPNASPSSQQSYFQGWTFAESPDTEFGSPPPPYTPSPGALGQTQDPAASMTIGGCDYPPLLGSLDPKLDCSGGFGVIRPVKRRCTANRKERRRTLSINNAFADLRDCIPNVPADTKLSKIKTLRLATSYIAYLMDILAQDPREHQTQHRSDFRADLCRKTEGFPREHQEPCMVKARKAAEAGASVGIAVTTPTEKKTKGRTGWPQHVWALELKHDP